MSCRLDRSDCRRSNGMDCMAGVRAEDLEERGWSVVVLESALHGRKRTVSEQIGTWSLSDGAVGVGHHRGLPVRHRARILVLLKFAANIISTHQ